MGNAGAFLDVNGVIIQNNCNDPKGAYYLLRPEDWVVLEGSADAHKLLKKKHYFIFWVTSQNSITEGLISREKLEGMFDAMREMFRAYCVGNVIDEIAIVTNDIVGNDSDLKIQQLKADVKVNAMLKLKDRYDIDMANSFGVGDRTSDIDGFQRAGIGSKYQILTPFGDKATEKADAYFESLLDCVKFHIS